MGFRVGVAVLCVVIGFLARYSASAAPAGYGGLDDVDGTDVAFSEAKDLVPFAKGLLNPKAGPAMAPEAEFPLALAAKRTRRPDALDGFKLYEGGWDITNEHYWASVAFTGAVGVVLGVLWFILFGLALCVQWLCLRRRSIKSSCSASRPPYLCFALLLLLTLAALAGCVLLSYGQNKFHSDALSTLRFIVNQSDFTGGLLQNVTDFLAFAETIHVEEIYLPSDVLAQIDKVKLDLADATHTLTEKTSETYLRIKEAISDVRWALAAVASLMLVLSVLGFLASVCGHQHMIYTFMIGGWILVAAVFMFLGVFVAIKSVGGDTCAAMSEWVQNPQAETALSEFLPCINEQTTNRTLYQSKRVVVLLVNLVNTAILRVANSDNHRSSRHRHHTGPTIPYLCSPYDSQLFNRYCTSGEVAVANASAVWANYIVDGAVSTTGGGKLSAEMYGQLAAAANVSYALYYYAPLVLNLQDCQFVRDAFSTITARHCPRLQRDLWAVCVGLALIASGVALICLLVMFLFHYADRLQREEVPAPCQTAAGGKVKFSQPV